jgi:MFS family permease
MSSLIEAVYGRDWPLKREISKHGPILIQFLGLLLAFKINRKIEWLWPTYWLLFPIAIAGLLLKVKLERFPAKWIPVRVKKTRQNKRPELRSDSSIGTEKALASSALIEMWKLIGFLSASYSLLHYPLLPVTSGVGLRVHAAASGTVLRRAASATAIRNTPISPGGVLDLHQELSPDHSSN